MALKPLKALDLSQDFPGPDSQVMHTLPAPHDAVHIEDLGGLMTSDPNGRAAA